jgi:hypothetical protein
MCGLNRSSVSLRDSGGVVGEKLELGKQKAEIGVRNAETE